MPEVFCHDSPFIRDDIISGGLLDGQMVGSEPSNPRLGKGSAGVKETVKVKEIDGDGDGCGAERPSAGPNPEWSRDVSEGT